MPDDGQFKFSGLPAGRHVVQNDVRTVELGAQRNNLCFSGVYRPTEQADQWLARGFGKDDPVRHVAVFVAHGGRDAEVIIKSTEQVETIDPLQVDQARRVGQTDRH